MQNRTSQRLPPLDLLVSFEAAARHLSFTRAAAERHVTQSAMSRQMQALEEEVGMPLFTRAHRSLVLTDAGLRLHASCSTVLMQLRQTLQQIRAPLGREVLSVTTTPGLASLWLIPRLPVFTRAHPGIDVRIDTSLDLRDLAAEGFDIAVRYLSANHSEGKQLFAEALQPVCSPALQRRKGGPPLMQPADLQAHTLLQITATPGSGMPLEWGTWLQAAGVGQLQALSVLSFNSYSEVITAALAGQGVALGRRPLVDALLRKRQLVTPFSGATSSRRAYFLVVEPAAKGRPAVAALARWMVQQAQEPT